MSSGEGTVEAPHQDLANAQAKELLQQAVDIERFEAVPEHGGNLQRLIERYGDKPGSCPYIKSMGEAGIQLVQELAEAEKNPDRGPTIRELMKAKEKETQSQTTDQDKPKSPKNTEAASATKADLESGKEADEVIAPTKTIEHILAQERSARIATETIKTPARLTVAPTSKTNKQRVESLSKVPPNLVVAEAESFLHQHTIELADRRSAEIKQLHNQIYSETVTHPTITQAPTTERPVTIEATTKPERRVDSIRELAARDIELEVVEDNASSDIETIDEGADTALGVVDSAIEEPLFDIDELMAELGLEHFFPEIGGTIEGTELVTEVDASQTDIEALEVNSEIIFDDAGLDLVPDIVVEPRKPAGETAARFLTETPGTSELRAKLSAYMETLEPDKAEVAETALKTLVEVLEVKQKTFDNGEEISEVHAIRIEYLFVELLESLNLDYEDEAAKQLLQSLLSPKIIAEITEGYELSIDLLNYLGTREYKPSSVTSLFTNLIQMTKRKIEPHLRLGKYALSVSMV